MNVAPGSSATPERSVSQTPVNALPSSNVPIHKAAAQDQDVSVVLNGAKTAPAAQSALPADSNASVNPTPTPVAAANGAIPPPPAASEVTSRKRLSQDRVGMLEDRIAEDPRGDIDAWLSLISEHRRKDKLEDARAVYVRFFKVFPSAAEQWIEYVNMELQGNNFANVERIFENSLRAVPNVHYWTTYLTYIRRRYNLTTDPTGTARQTVSLSYDFVLQNVGIDKDAGQLWQDYIDFIRSGPGNVGGNSWQDQQKMDSLRKAYQKAICIPTEAVTALWKQYDSFELSLNKVTGRKFLQEKSPAYMTARGAQVDLEKITRDLNRTTIPRLPPALGFDGDLEFVRQVDIWKKWIAFEKEDPLVLKDEDLNAYRQRVVHVYRQALMALRFWPEMWYEAAEFCYQNDMQDDGDDFLNKGCEANPESCLLAFKRADRVELTTTSEEGEESIIRRGEAVREPYQKVLDSLYELIQKTKARETATINRIKEAHAQQVAAEGEARDDDDEEDEEASEASKARDAALQTQIEAIQKGNAAQVKLLSTTISFAWIALIRAMRRIQGKGKPGDKIGGFRGVFADARKAGRITSDVYLASALIEYHCYRDPAATKILERGMKLFPEDEEFALEYLRHLIANNDITNARAVFKTTVNRLAQKPETLSKAKPIYAFFHEYESHYGELSQVVDLEKRMAELFPEDPTLSHFSHRYSKPTFDPTAIRPIISPLTQARPKALLPIPPMEQQQQQQQQKQPSAVPTAIPAAAPAPVPVPSVTDSPRPLPLPMNNNSPKRAYQQDDSDTDSAPARKIARGESPLKGAAGRRLAAQTRNNHQQGGGGSSNLQHMQQAAGPAPLPRDITFLLSIIPPAHTYHAARFVPERIADALRAVQLPNSWPPAVRPMPVTAQQLGWTGGMGQMGNPYFR
ncbi:Suf-domain-containing protein [Saccharata proteae CBS 121410]|uniref:mRNA 3'-end-processing protein RNA14 n=1 Tax=Saccharata proteae CBS 121410 TaxID=1314787 RepID=A0A9P4HWJ3_9PEZI|nr:Suf-domain-containing protein [Saccharata proteae CBS 121410]